MYNPYSLDNKTILVTGASSGIGKAVAIECSRLGARIIITARNEERLKQTFNELEGDGHLMLLCDLSTEESILRLVGEVPELDGLVNNAGFTIAKPIRFIDEKDFKSLLDVIRHRRNKYIAHNDPDYFFHSDPKDLAVQDNKSYALPHLWSLINDTGALLEVLWHNLSTDDISLKCQYNRDLADLFPNETLSVMKPIG